MDTVCVYFVHILQKLMIMKTLASRLEECSFPVEKYQFLKPHCTFIVRKLCVCYTRRSSMKGIVCKYRELQQRPYGAGVGGEQFQCHTFPNEWKLHTANYTDLRL
jgi:hypothetical protein